MQENNFKRYILKYKFQIGIVFISLAFLSSFSFAWAHIGVPLNGLVPCTNNCDVCNLYDLAHNLIDLMLWGIATPLLVVALLAAGFFWLTSAGSEDKISKGRSILFSAVVGFVIAFGAWVIINTIMDTLAYKNPLNGTAWSDTSFCANSPVKPGQVGVTPPPGTTPPSTTPPTTTPPTTTPPSGNLTAVDSNLPIKSGNACSAPTCLLDSALQQKLIAMNNSITADGRSGMWQITEAYPPTVQHQNQCHYTGTCIDAGLLGSNNNNASSINYFITKAEGAGLRPVYEVQNSAQKDSLINQGVPSSKILVVPGINAAHFSVYNI